MKRSVFLVLAGLGFALSLALELLHVRAYTAPSAESFCAIGERLDCESVALSRYSVIGSVPVALIGAVGFLAIGLAAFRSSRWLLWLSGFGALASLGLLAVEVFAIGALCLLCEAVHVVAFALFALAIRARSSLTGPLGARDGLAFVLAPPVGLLVALALFVPRYWAEFGWKGDVPFPTGTTEEGYPWIGAENPRVTVHEFTDYYCAHCRAATGRMLRRIAAQPTEIRVVRRQYPRMRCPKDPSTCILVRAAICAGDQGKFWQADRWLFDRGPRRARFELTQLAQDLGLDLPELDACYTSERTYERADADARMALKMRLPGTPYYIVGKRRGAESNLDTLLVDE